MAKKTNYSVNGLISRLGRERKERVDDISAMIVTKSVDFAEDMELVARLEKKVVTDIQRASLSRSREWMTNTQKSLMPAIRNKYLRWEASIKRHERNGTEWVPDPNFIPKRQRATVIKKTQPPRPDWMDNPALLPKKPPGRS